MTVNNFKLIRNMRAGFSLVELLIVISIIGVLSSVMLPALNRAREKAIFVRAISDMKEMTTALELYADAHEGEYPPDVSRDIPPGLEAYINTANNWPDAGWPGSIFDWDNWIDPDTDNPIYQISIRFCPISGGIEDCIFPNETWAENFDINSAVYYCVAGACRAHISEPIDYPGYCVNCDVQPSAP